jgi:phosphatidylethanolamine-binding protein (PEBP) family uncharacterized protein
VKQTKKVTIFKFSCVLGYTPPCPPVPQEHTYRIHVYARAEEKTVLDVSSRDAREVLKQLETGNLAVSDELDGLYKQPSRS